jgi:endonuclease YncB( thermonuclease family)
VVDVIDGDTIKCQSPDLDATKTDQEKPMCRAPDGVVLGSCWSIRLLRIDTGETTCHDKACTKPRWTCEAEHDAGMAAKERVRELVAVADGVLVLTKIKRDRYSGRRDAEVWGNGVNFSDVLLRENLAAPYKGTAANRKKKWCGRPEPRPVIPPSK